MWRQHQPPSQQLPSPARAPLCSDRAARRLESATLAEPTGVVHVSRAEVGTRDATGTNCETPRHSLATGKLRKVLGAAGRPGQRTRSRHRSGSVRDIAAMPAGVVGQQQPDSRQRAATSHGGARRRAVSARTLGEGESRLAVARGPSSWKSPAVLRTRTRTQIWAANYCIFFIIKKVVKPNKIRLLYTSK